MSGTKKLRVAFLLCLVPGLIGVGLASWPVSSGLEKTYGLDFLFKLRGRQPKPADVCVIAYIYI